MVPDEYKATFRIDEEIKASDNKRKNEGELCDTDDDNDDSDEEDMQIALQILEEKRNAKKKKEEKRLSATKVGKGKQGETTNKAKQTKRSSD